MIYSILTILFSYFLGSIPTAVWIGKFFYKIDIREHGSGNSGSTNTFRVLGIPPGIIVLLIDILKGFFAVHLVYFKSYKPNTDAFITFSIVLGIVAVLGHIFPIYAKFKGGKGVATLLGVVFAIHTAAAFMTLPIFLIVLLISRYVSLSSMVSGIAFPILLIFFFETKSLPLIIFSISISILLLITHKKNILRIINRTESKANLFNK